MITLISVAVRVKPPLLHCATDVGDMLHSIIEYIINNVGELEFLTTPQKLLKSIDTVEKAMMEQLQTIKETPAAKKEKREKKIEI
nr:protein polychome [Quercus suber]